MSTLEENVQRLIDIEDIKILKLKYARFCDEGYDPEKIASCFTADGIWDGGDFGVHIGRQNIKAGFTDAGKQVAFAIHYTTNPIIEIEGDQASGTWYLWQPMVFKEGHQSMWYMAHYEERYVRENGQWLIKHLKLKAKSLTPNESPFTTQS